MEPVHAQKSNATVGHTEANETMQKKAAPAFALTAAPAQLKTEGGEDPVGPGYYAAGQTTREWGFALRHPIAALAIGSVSKGSTNISTNAVRFSTNDLGLKESKSHEGSEVNAFRHTLWQAEISNEYGDDIAHQAGNAHEADPFAIGGDKRSTTSFKSEAKADESCDLRNNEIGRSIGNSDDPKEMNVLALKVLEYYHNTGLWVVTPQKDGTFTIAQQRIDDTRYKEAKTRLEQLNVNGFDAQQQGVRDEAARKELERMQQRDLRGPKF